MTNTKSLYALIGREVVPCEIKKDKGKTLIVQVKSTEIKVNKGYLKEGKYYGPTLPIVDSRNTREVRLYIDEMECYKSALSALYVLSDKRLSDKEREHKAMGELRSLLTRGSLLELLAYRHRLRAANKKLKKELIKELLNRVKTEMKTID